MVIDDGQIRLRRSDTLSDNVELSHENTPMLKENSTTTSESFFRSELNPKLTSVYFKSIFVAWCILFLWCEYAISIYYSYKCPSPLSDQLHDEQVYQVIILADPQLTDYYSYKQSRGSLSLSITEYYSDLYMRRNFNALMVYTIPIYIYSYLK